jgi:hypothetical protein
MRCDFLFTPVSASCNPFNFDPGCDVMESALLAGAKNDTIKSATAHFFVMYFQFIGAFPLT